MENRRLKAVQIEQKKAEEEEITIDLVDLFLAILRHWFVILLSTVLAAAIAFAGCKLLKEPRYESTAEMYVFSKSTSVTELADLQLGNSLTNDYIVVVTGRPVLDQVSKNLGLNLSYGAIRGMVSVSNPTNSRILQITVNSANPEQAKLIADEVANVSAAFISEKMDQSPPSIIQYGYVNPSPVGPSTKKNTILGALVGFFLAVVVVGLTHLFDDSVVTVEDVEKKLGINVLGQLPLDEEEYDGKHKKKKKSKRSA